MSSINSLASFCLLFVHLIGGVNHDRVNSTDYSISDSFSTNTTTGRSFDLSILTNHSIDELSQRLFCPPYDSCSGRCGDFPNGLPYTCNCDSKCSAFGDCCVDFDIKCANSIPRESVVNADASQITCEVFFDSFPLYSVSKCSERWNNSSSSHARLCTKRVSSDCVLSNVFSDLGLDELKNQCESFVNTECLQRFSRYCNSTIEPRCEVLSKKECRRMSVSKCRRCETSFWPVVDANGNVYPNSYCAECNFQDEYTIVDFETLAKIVITNDNSNDSFTNVTTRSCIAPGVSTCPDNSNTTRFSELCKNTSGPAISSWKTNLVYKNVYCAICNGVEADELECVGSGSDDSEETSLMRSMEYKVMDFVSGITADIQGLRLDDIPAAFSILLNFGLNGRQRVYISSEEGETLRTHQENCEAGNIWDPFSKICRKIHCSAEFVLVDYQCIKENEEGKDPDEIAIPDASSDFVHLSFSAEMELTDILIFANQEVDQIKESIRQSFSSAFDITIERIRNVTFNISLGNLKSKKAAFKMIDDMDDFSLINFTFSMDLFEPTQVVDHKEPSVDSVVSMLASALSYNGFQLGINNTVSRIYQVQQSVNFVESWCEPPAGRQLKYYNSEFKLILNDDTTANITDRVKGIYVNKTGRFYPKGSFIADILYQGYQFNRHLINVSGLAVVCDWKVRLNSSCLRLVLKEHEYSVDMNGSLLIHNPLLRGSVDRTVYEKTDEGDVLVCLSSEMSNRANQVYQIEMDKTQAVVTYVLSWVSVVAMVAVLFTYSLFSSLRNLPGCNTMNLTCSLIVMQVTFIFGQRRTVTGLACKAVACVFHYEILCCFMWMNVIAYDLFKTFGGDKSTLSNIRSKRKYLPRYMGYAYGVPLILILFTCLLDHFALDWVLSPRYGGYDVCWITNRNAAIAYFAIPLAVLMLINFLFFVMTILSISGVKHLLSLRSNHKGKSDVMLYARMALVIGLTWALAFTAAFVNEEKVTGQILTYLFIVFNTLQGVFVFIVFVCNHRVWELYRDGFRKVVRKVTGQALKPSTSAAFKGFSHIVERSVSTNTIVSTFSNASSCGSNDSGLETIREDG